MSEQDLKTTTEDGLAYFARFGVHEGLFRAAFDVARMVTCAARSGSVDTFDAVVRSGRFRARWADEAVRLGEEELAWGAVAERVEALLLGQSLERELEGADTPSRPRVLRSA